MLKSPVNKISPVGRIALLEVIRKGKKKKYKNSSRPKSSLGCSVTYLRQIEDFSKKDLHC